MEQEIKFTLENFTPRLGVVDELICILEDLQAQVPVDCGFRAVISKRNDLFDFDITLQSATETFQSKQTIDTGDRRCRERYWQVLVVRSMVKEIQIQIRDWHQRRFAA